MIIIVVTAVVVHIITTTPCFGTSMRDRMPNLHAGQC
jgi:hypothetical protein